MLLDRLVPLQLLYWIVPFSLEGWSFLGATESILGYLRLWEVGGGMGRLVKWFA